MPDDPCTRILIVGAGFAGTQLVRSLHRRLPAGIETTLLSDESYTTFNPMLPEAVGASVFPEQVVVPVREMTRQGGACRFIMGSVIQIDLAGGRLVCRTLAGERELAYDHLVLAVGNRARLDLLPGMAEHALPLKTVGDAMHIRNTVLRRLACIELEDDASARRALGHFIVVGGGFSGVEVAGELVDCLASIRRYYPRVAADELRVTVLQGLDRLLPELSPRLGIAALNSLRERGVDVRLMARATCITADGVQLGDGEFIEGRTVIGTIGTAANPLLARLGLPISGGRVVVAGDLSVPGYPGLWAVGDCACVPNALDGSTAPPTAQFAVREAQHLARNLGAVVTGAPTTAFRYRSRGMMASIGHLKGVAEVAGVPLTGWPAWLVWRAYYLSQMPSFGRRLRIFFEWFWGMFYPPDITHLRFTRSAELGSDEERRQREASATAAMTV
ncbi:NAD(P)/FAD-dependent oxidoreductase [Methylibium sp.]|uniref:NAD(P)/FAD-dependent oxidoreductase n=1 Tax=Methylibium sp. TaxID=2067992 RepID=UPI003D11A3EC